MTATLLNPEMIAMDQGASDTAFRLCFRVIAFRLWFHCRSLPKTVPCIAVQDPLGVSGRVGPGTKTWVSISLIAAVIAVPL